MYCLLSLLLGAIAAIASINRETNVIAAFVGGLTFLIFWAINWAIMPTMNFWGFDGIWIRKMLCVFGNVPHKRVSAASKS